MVIGQKIKFNAISHLPHSVLFHADVSLFPDSKKRRYSQNPLCLKKNPS